MREMWAGADDDGGWESRREGGWEGVGWRRRGIAGSDRILVALCADIGGDGPGMDLCRGGKVELRFRAAD